jgi:hypothetical protein
VRIILERVKCDAIHEGRKPLLQCRRLEGGLAFARVGDRELDVIISAYMQHTNKKKEIPCVVGKAKYWLPPPCNQRYRCPLFEGHGAGPTFPHVDCE